MENLSIYQINTRAFCFERGQKLIDIPMTFFRNLKKQGIDYIWLMGVWKPLSKECVKKYCFHEDLIKEYKKVLDDFTDDDVVGSPYAISNYRLNPSLGKKEDLLLFKEKLNDIGLKLILDFVPNHFGVETPVLKKCPEVFLGATKEEFKKDSFNFFESDFEKGKYFAHGKDPNFFAWQDTVQVNYFGEDARKFMTKTLLEIAKVCDGVRCDMAMLDVNSIFKKTWGETRAIKNTKEPQEEFWKEAISEVKEKHPSFLFLAEVYWDMEWDLQQLGFDYTYDKRLLERLEYETAATINAHLKGDINYQQKLIRFIENHDEKRSLVALPREKAKMAAIIISTIPGMRFYYDGQFEGKLTRTPVQLRRDKKEEIDYDIKNFYEVLLKITKDKVFKKGDWTILDATQGADPLSFNNILSWIFEYKNERRLVVVNYSEYESSCHLKFNLDGVQGEKIILDDLLNNVQYEREKSNLNEYGLYVSLKPYSAHIFSF